jgi:hypothetical protein
MIRRPGYGDHLAATVDPGIRERQADISAPPGFADAIAWLAPLASGHDHWHVIFTVGSRDESASTAEKIGAVVLSSDDTDSASQLMALAASWHPLNKLTAW